MESLKETIDRPVLHRVKTQGLRVLFIAPALLLTVAGVGMLARAPTSWGVADHIEMPAWLIPASAVLFGAPPALAGALALKRIWAVTGGRFSIMWAHLPLALFPIAGSIVLVALASGIADPASYDHMRNSEGQVTVTPEGLFAGAVMMSLFGQAFLCGATYVYAQAFVEEYGRDPKSPVDVDRVAGLLRRT